MKSLAVVLLAASLFCAAPVALAQAHGHGAPKTAVEREAAVSHKGVGIVKKSDPDAGTVTLSHEPIASLGWPAMTMPFQVKDRKMLETLKTDQRVEFSFVQQGPKAVITSIR